ncbi:sensory neuron membrane protein 1-like isoform X2 [Rhodnius prolixus]|uniref:sensory neuron membrane protein 1-like isoform X2 n=1 Tax=Rhodnius prolixus TaxID=13249 RepID=UPI003D18ADC6
MCYNVALRKGGDMRKAWSKFPIAVEFRIFIFNVTNPLEVHQGAKPKVQEIGPYFFDEWKEKALFEDDAKEDTVAFNQKTTWIFQKSQSGGLTGEEMITIPHAALLGMVLMVEQQKPGALPMIAKALPALFNGPETVFLTAKAMDILFDGVPINCTSKEFGPKAICTMIRQNPKGLKKQGDDIFLFSFFGTKNGTIDDGRFKVKRGINNPKEVGMMFSFNGKTVQEVWSGPECNALRGTDSTIFPPFITPDEEIVSFAPDLCRSLGAKFQYHINYRGIPGNHYTATLGDMSANEDEKCFCPTPSTCLKKGAFDITKCVGAPIILTLPHFYEADPSYLEEVDGLHPNKENHQIFLNFEPITGTPLGARKRLQFNMRIHAIKKVPLMKNLPDAMIPLFWVEEGLELSQEFIDLLDASLFRSMRIVGVSKWVLMLVGLGMIAGGYLLHYNRTKGLGDKPPVNEKPKSIQVASVTPPKF